MMRLVLILSLALAVPAAAAPELSGDAAKAWKKYQRARGIKAFASNGGEAWGYAWKAKSKEQAELLAVGSCRMKLRGGEAPCQLVDSTKK